MKDIKEAVGNRKILTAQQVKKLPTGSVVWLNYFDKGGQHAMTKFYVVDSYKRKELATDPDHYGNKIIKRIEDKPGECYTVTEGKNDKGKR